MDASNMLKPRWRAARCASSGQPPSTSTGATSRRTLRSSASSSPCSSTSRRGGDDRVLQGLRDRYEATTASASARRPWWRPPSCPTAHQRPLPARQGDRPDRPGAARVRLRSKTKPADRRALRTSGAELARARPGRRGRGLRARERLEGERSTSCVPSLKRAAGRPRARGGVLADDIAEVVSRRTGIPVAS